MPIGSPANSAGATSSTAPSAWSNSGDGCPAFTTVTVCAAGSSTARASVTNFSGMPARIICAFSRVTAAAGSGSASRHTRASTPNFAITSAAATPCPATSPSSTAVRPPGSGTKS